MFKPIAFLLAAAVMTFTAQVQAAPTAEQKQAVRDRLRAADTDGDGLISRAEAEANLPRLAQRFDKLDTNQDGKLSQEEMREMASRFQGRRRR